MRFGILIAVVGIGCGSAREASKPVEESAPSIESAPTIASIEPKAEEPKPDDKLDLGNHEMSGIIRDGRLAIVPILAKTDVPREQMLTLDVGMRNGKVHVREMRDFTVDLVRVTNKARVPLLILRGEVITGAHQDRAFAETKVILAGATEEVSVRCIEEDRDRGGGKFRSGNALAELTLRRAIAHGDQNQVWREVNEINERLDIHKNTRTYRHAAALHAQGANRERTDRLMAQLAAHPDRDRMVGVAVAIDGQVLAIDRFPTPAVFQTMQPKLLGSYAASDFGGVQEGRQLTPEAVRALQKLTGDDSLDALQPLQQDEKAKTALTPIEPM